jgi:hypothetical protein
LAERLPGDAKALRDDFRKRGLEKPIIERIVDIIEHCCGLTRTRFANAKAAPSA